MPLKSSKHSAENKNHYNSAYTSFLTFKTSYVRMSSNLNYTSRIVTFSELILLRHHKNSRLEMI